MVIAVITSNTERIEFRDSYELKGKHLMHWSYEQCKHFYLVQTFLFFFVFLQKIFIFIFT